MSASLRNGTLEDRMAETLADSPPIDYRSAMADRS